MWSFVVLGDQFLFLSAYLPLHLFRLAQTKRPPLSGGPSLPLKNGNQMVRACASCAREKDLAIPLSWHIPPCVCGKLRSDPPRQRQRAPKRTRGQIALTTGKQFPTINMVATEPKLIVSAPFVATTIFQSTNANTTPHERIYDDRQTGR